MQDYIYNKFSYIVAGGKVVVKLLGYDSFEEEKNPDTLFAHMTACGDDSLVPCFGQYYSNISEYPNNSHVNYYVRGVVPTAMHSD